MRAPVYFRRGVGAGISAAAPALGTSTDPLPTFRSAKRRANAGGKDTSCSFEFRDETAQQIFVGYRYEGGGSAAMLPVALYVWEETIGSYLLADSGTLTNGRLTHLKCPVPIPPPQTRQALLQPNNSQHCLVVVSDNASPAGVCHFIAGPGASKF